MTNFDFLKNETKFDAFSDVAISAERVLSIDLSTSVLNCRRAMEFAIKWMYSVDNALIKPWDEKLVSLMGTEEFRDMVGNDMWQKLNFIRKMGNNAAHTGKKIMKEQAALCIENLFTFMDFIAHCYVKGYQKRKFDSTLLEQNAEAKIPEVEIPDINLEELIKENKALKEKLTARREEQKKTYKADQDISEFKTRKLYIDVMLEDAGWVLGKNWVNELPVSRMPNKSGTGRIDYALYGDNGKILAIVEAKRTCADVAQGRQQAKLYADIIEKQQDQRPVVFLTNGFETRIIDNTYPERPVAAIYSKRDLEKWFNLQSMRGSLKNIKINKEIAGRYYQEGAIKAVCNAFERKKRRKALLVMATGSGKTRTVIELIDVLLQKGWLSGRLFVSGNQV